MSEHDFFDLDLTFWRQAPESIEKEELWRHWPLVSPLHMVAVERYRAGLGLDNMPEGWRETDIFLMSFGTPPRRDLTQVGGLPYRPAHDPWPTRSDGVQLKFLAQIRFRESKDIVRSLPGDLLLIFCSPEITVHDWRFEWRQLGIPDSDLIVSHKDESQKPDFIQCFGHRFRTFDPPSVDSARGYGGYLVLPATKVGGAITGGNMFKMPSDRHFATLSSIAPLFGFEHPWINVQSIIPDGTAYRRNGPVSFYDDFSANLFLNDDGTVSHQFEIPY